MHYLAFIAVPFVFLIDCLAIVFWLLRTAENPPRNLRYSMRTLLIATTITAIHLAIFTAFLSIPTN